jgi:ribonucleoside-diphosphate reductase alpha chain
LVQQREEAAAKRRIGVGFTGLGNTLAMLCLRYDSDAGRAMAARIARQMRDAAYAASVALAMERGPFPLFDPAQYFQPGNFASRLPQALQQAIASYGIRNSHLLSIAPTGTVSLAFADNASNGIEPAFSWVYRRKKRLADGSTQDYAVEDHAWRLYRHLGGDVNALPDYFVSALEMAAQDHLAMMQAVQPFVDTAISKTVNVAADYPFSEFRDLYLQAWQAGLKGLATYRPNSILGAVLDVPPTPAAGLEAAALSPDPMRSVIESRPRGALSAVAEKIEYWTQEGRKTLYLVVSFLPVEATGGQGSVDRAIEFFMPVGQDGESQHWVTASLRLLALAARGGFLQRALGDMRKVAWDRGPVRLGRFTRHDGAQLPLWHDSEVAALAYAIENIIGQRQSQATAPVPPHGDAVSTQAGLPPMGGRKCQECGARAVIRKDGCEHCSACGWLGHCG